MPVKKRRRRYHLKPVPIIVAGLVVIGIIIGIGFLASGVKKMFGKEGGNPSSDNSSHPSSVPVVVVPKESSDLPALDPSSDEESSDPSSEPSSIPSSAPSSKATSSKATSSEAISSDDEPQIDDSDAVAYQGDWKTILVNNNTTPLANELSFEKTKIDSQYVDTRAAEHYNDMLKAAKADGITLFLRSGYRSIKQQTQNYNASVKRYTDGGKTNEEAVKLTDQYYARPGQSEHHTGLAFDIITPEYHNDIHSLDDRFAETDAYKWLIKHCAEYGFVLRYPADKVSVTGINYEPWHYRYVGQETAKYIMSSGLCLEELFA